LCLKSEENPEKDTSIENASGEQACHAYIYVWIINEMREKRR